MLWTDSRGNFCVPLDDCVTFSTSDAACYTYLSAKKCKDNREASIQGKIETTWTDLVIGQTVTTPGIYITDDALVEIHVHGTSPYAGYCDACYVPIISTTPHGFILRCL